MLDPPQAVRLSMAAAAIPATANVVRLMVCISVSPLLCRWLPAANIAAAALSRLLGTDPWLVSQWVFGCSEETDGWGIGILFSYGNPLKIRRKRREPRSEDRGSRCVRKGGLEPPRPKAQEPKSCVSANFTTRARRRRRPGKNPGGGRQAPLYLLPVGTTARVSGPGGVWRHARWPGRCIARRRPCLRDRRRLWSG